MASPEEILADDLRQAGPIGHGVALAFGLFLMQEAASLLRELLLVSEVFLARALTPLVLL